ncbi:hypothetical protein ACFLZU_01725 [Thermodesulfobacteriota bacterium]
MNFAGLLTQRRKGKETRRKGQRIFSTEADVRQGDNFELDFLRFKKKLWSEVWTLKRFSLRLFSQPLRLCVKKIPVLLI